MWLTFPSDYLDYGALGAAMFTLLVCVAVLYRTLMFVREIFGLVLERIQQNTATLAQLAERLRQSEHGAATHSEEDY